MGEAASLMLGYLPLVVFCGLVIWLALARFKRR